MKRDIDYYDLIITGDLGKIGSNLFKDLLKENNIKLKSYIDAGSNLILDKNLTCQGASGPVCLPLVFFNKILKQNKYSKVLLIGTGALHNTYIVNQKRSIPCISHAISLEVTY
jgi:stage V sporulation protein AD